MSKISNSKISKSTKIRKSNILCIYDNVELRDLFKKYYPLVLSYNIAAYVIYFGGMHNPPFFDIVIITETNKRKDEYQMCWNMVIEGGSLIIPKSEIKHLDNIIKSDIKGKDCKPFYDTDYIIVHKNTTYLYIFYDKYRIIDFVITGYNDISFIKLLSSHSDIDIKHANMDFLSRNWTKSIEWYKGHFNYKKKMVGNYDENIIYLPYLHPMLQKMNSCVKIIIILKNPIQRAYEEWISHKNNTSGEMQIVSTFEGSIRDELKFHWNEPLNPDVAKYHYLQRGLYYKQIIELMRYFPKQNIYIFIEGTHYEKMRNIYNFLQIRDIKHMHNLDYKSNSMEITSEQYITPKLYNIFLKFFKEDVEKLEKEILGYKTNWFIKK
jgi:hypothetical protein